MGCNGAHAYLVELRALAAPGSREPERVARLLSAVRSTAWRHWLGALPLDASRLADSLVLVRAQHDAYSRLVATHLSNPRAHPVARDLVIDNPLSQHESSAWSRHFEHHELQAQILRDVARLFPGDAFFASEANQERLLRLLSVWALEHPAINYRQGLHELIAPLLLVRQADADAYVKVRWRQPGWAAPPPLAFQSASLQPNAEDLSLLDVLYDSPYVEVRLSRLRQ
ncbi:rab-GTPase-TBC domain-containing protein [Pavlovales sp. CCMP2436]|nr:rab-GTPase-TBC domain-containing protein [Pavlovales sp. CCMP2436]